MITTKEVKYTICQFIHKDKIGQWCIHKTDYTIESFEDYSLQAIKSDVERTTQLNFIKDEDKLIKRKVDERLNGVRKQEKYLMLS